MLIDVYGVKVTGSFTTKRAPMQPNLPAFDLMLTNGDTKVVYETYIPTTFCQVDPSGVSYPKLTKRGLHEGLSYFVSSALHGSKLEKRLASELGLDKYTLQIIEDYIIRLYMVPPGKLKTNV